MRNITKILVVEDHELLVKTIVYRLRKEGYEVASALDGLTAKALFESFQPDIVITDLMLPFATGFELIAYMRKTLESTVPIIVLTAVDMENSLVEAFELGADDYLTKPFKPVEMLARIKRLCSR